MDNRTRQILNHIVVYCGEVDKAVEKFGKDFSVFDKDVVFKNAVSMPILQIGELTKKLDEVFRAATEERFHWKAIAGMRDKYAHGYSTMSNEIIWDTAINSVPELQEQCVVLLKEADQVREEDKENESELEL